MELGFQGERPGRQQSVGKKVHGRILYWVADLVFITFDLWDIIGFIIGLL